MMKPTAQPSIVTRVDPPPAGYVSIECLWCHFVVSAKTEKRVADAFVDHARWHEKRVEQ